MLRRVLIWLAIAVSAVSIYAWLFGGQTAIVLEEHYFARNSPSMWAVPVQLADTSVSESLGRKLSYLGCEFEVPWNDLDEQKTRLIGSWQLIAFHSGKGIVLAKFPAKERVNAYPVLGQKLDMETVRKLRLIYGEDTLQSDYAFTRAVLEMTPGSVSIFAPRREAVRSMMLMTFKPILARDGASGMYIIQTKHLHGFQYGNPQRHPPEIVDELFSDNSRLEFTFPCKSPASCPSQGEINLVIQTARLTH